MLYRLSYLGDATALIKPNALRAVNSISNYFDRHLDAPHSKLIYKPSPAKTCSNSQNTTPAPQNIHRSQLAPKAHAPRAALTANKTRQDQTADTADPSAWLGGRSKVAQHGCSTTQCAATSAVLRDASQRTRYHAALQQRLVHAAPSGFCLKLSALGAELRALGSGLSALGAGPQA